MNFYESKSNFMAAQISQWGISPPPIRVSQGSKNVYNPTGISVKKAQWDTNKQALKGVQADNNNPKYIEYLSFT